MKKATEEDVEIINGLLILFTFLFCEEKCEECETEMVYFHEPSPCDFKTICNGATTYGRIPFQFLKTCLCKCHMDLSPEQIQSLCNRWVNIFENFGKDAVLTRDEPYNVGEMKTNSWTRK